MFVLPMRPQPPRFKNTDCCATSSALLPTDQNLYLVSRTQQETAGAMISMMPSIRPDMSKRPKLSLKTCMPSIASEGIAKSATGSYPIAATPTYTKNYINALDCAYPSPTKTNLQDQEPSTPTSSIDPACLPSSASSTSSMSSEQMSPYPASAPYSLSIGSRSILRNSPLPRPYLSLISARAPRKMFSPVKKVLFREILEDIIPGQALEALSEASDSDNSGKRRRDYFVNDDNRGRRITEEENKQSTSVHGRRKRRREWIWRPLEDDILVSQQTEKSPAANDSKDKTAIREGIAAGNPGPPSTESMIESAEITSNGASPRHGSEPILRNSDVTADQLHPHSLHEIQCNSEIAAAGVIRDHTSET